MLGWSALLCQVKELASLFSYIVEGNYILLSFCRTLVFCYKFLCETMKLKVLWLNCSSRLCFWGFLKENKGCVCLPLLSHYLVLLNYDLKGTNSTSRSLPVIAHLCCNQSITVLNGVQSTRTQSFIANFLKQSLNLYQHSVFRWHDPQLLSKFDNWQCLLNFSAKECDRSSPLLCIFLRL